MVTFIDQHRDTYGVEPLCAVLPIAPSTYFLQKQQQATPTTRSPRRQRDDDLRAAIQRVWDDNDRAYGPRKVWKQLRRDGHRVARCTVERLMRDMGLTREAYYNTVRPQQVIFRIAQLIVEDLIAGASGPGADAAKAAKAKGLARHQIFPDVVKILQKYVSSGKVKFAPGVDVRELALERYANQVYSHNGQHVLIPAGARVLGETRPVQALGETRLAVAFHRLLMPDGSTRHLDQFIGLNQIGDAGLKDKVNHHYWSTFGAAAAVGLISGLAQWIGSAGYSSGSGDRTVIIAGGADAASQASLQVMSRFLNRLPTVTIREGHRVKVYLTSDIELPAYTAGIDSRRF